MKVLIIEDEVPAAEKLQRLIHKYDPNIEILGIIEHVAQSVEWLRDHQEKVDLIFMDIQLIDGKSFEIFEQVKIRKPIIFTTAYDAYALEAFKVNSIDYLLKPITYDDLKESLEKLQTLKDNLTAWRQWPDLDQLIASVKEKVYKNRFMVKLGEHIRSVTTDHIALFYADGRIVYLITSDHKKFVIDFKLEELENLLDPKDFFRVNRSCILNINAIEDVLVYSNSRLKITPTVQIDKEIIVSREKVPLFKAWFSGGDLSGDLSGF